MAGAVPAAETAERWVSHVHAEQRAASLPLLVTGGAVLVEAAMQLHPFWDSRPAHLYVLATSGLVSALLPVAAFLVLWIWMRVRRARSGLGTGRQGYGAVLLLTLGILVLVPFATFFVGPVLIIGIGVAILGGRGRDRGMVMTGLVLGALSPFAALHTFENRAQFLGPAPTTTVLVLAGAVVIALGVGRLRAERRVLAASPAP